MGAEPAQHESPTVKVDTDLQRRLSSFGKVSCDHRVLVNLHIHCFMYHTDNFQESLCILGCLDVYDHFTEKGL